MTYPFLTNLTQCEVLLDENDDIRQIRSEECLADVAVSNAFLYAIHFYPTNAIGAKDAQGFYTLSGDPIRSAFVQNPDSSGNSSNKVNVTLRTGALTNMSAAYEWTNSMWKLEQGGGLVTQYKSVVWTNNDTVRISTLENKDTNGAVLSCVVRRYEMIGTNSLLVEHTEGVGAQAQSTTYSYYTNGASIGLQNQINHPDGSWEIFQFDGNRLLTNKCVSFLNQAPTTNISLCRSFEYRYGTNAVPGAGDKGSLYATTPRCTIERILGYEVARQYQIFSISQRREIQCTEPGASWDDPDNLVTIHTFYSDGENHGWPQSIEYPDGTLNIFQYFTTSSFRTNILSHGQPNAEKTAIIDGTQDIKVLNFVGEVVSQTRVDIASGLMLSLESRSDPDEFNRMRKTTYLDGTHNWTDYGCCGPITQTNREGTLTRHFQDMAARPTATQSAGITRSNVLNSAGHVLRSIRIGTNGSQIVQATNAYNTKGVLLSTTDALGQTTTFSEVYTNGQLFQRITTYPDQSTRIEEFYRDGQRAKVTGTAAHPVRYEYGVVSEGGVWRQFTRQIRLDGSGTDTSEILTNFFDMAGRSYLTLYAGGASRRTYFNTKGQRIKEVDPDGVTTLFQYNPQGELEYTATDMDRNGAIDFAGADRIRRSAHAVTTTLGSTVRQTDSFVWPEFNSAVSNLVSTRLASTDGRKTWSISDGLTNRSQIHYAGQGERFVTNTAPDGSYSVARYVDGRIRGQTRYAWGGGQLSSVAHYYDAHGRLTSTVDARNGTNSYNYDDADRRIAMTTPAPGTGQSAQTTGYTFDYAGRLTITSLPDGTSHTNEYHPSGQLKKSSGSRAYPVEYKSDAQGRTTNMITWRDYAGDSGKAITSWIYDAQRGFLAQKKYDDGNGPSYTYTPAGRLLTRQWERGITASYQTNAAGDIVGTSYDDGLTPTVSYYLDRQGRRTNIVDGSGSRILTYSLSGRLLSETNISGALAGIGSVHAYDEFQRRTNLAAHSASGQLLSQRYGFDDASRLTNAAQGDFSAAYSYLANSSLIEEVTYRSNSITRMTSSRSHDYLGRLLETSAQPAASGAKPIRYRYTYNQANQRIQVEDPDGAYWNYEYDKLGQVVSGKRFWADGTPVAGQQHEYAFDDIGNRQSTREGGDAQGDGLRLANYTVNALNQYTARDVPGAVDVTGIARADATVTVNGAAATRQGEYFWKELPIANSSSAVFQTITNLASYSGQTATNIIEYYLPKTQEQFNYDADGNLTNDGRWVFTWDGENRLIGLEPRSGVPDGAKLKFGFTYDDQGRRVSKVVSNWTGSAWALLRERRFVRDRWNLVAEVDGNLTVVRTYLWGTDLSGSMHGAGGVGGLLYINDPSNGVHAVAYDGNGNVCGLVNMADGDTSARYEYDPFGRTTRATGLVIAAQPYRFSTKYHDESGLVDYGHRYYHPSIGRWLNTDPIGESSENNIHCFLMNDPVSSFDLLGMIQVEAVSPFIKGNCGEFHIDWLITLDNIPQVDGYIIQHIEFSYYATTCLGHTISKAFDYYEAMPITAGQVEIKDQAGTTILDEWFYGESEETQGHLQMKGELKFFPKSLTGDLGNINVDSPSPMSDPWLVQQAYGGATSPIPVGSLDNTGNFAISDNLPYNVDSGSFPSTDQTPSFWNMPSIEQFSGVHLVTRQWNCCCPFIDPNEGMAFPPPKL